MHGIWCMQRLLAALAIVVCGHVVAVAQRAQSTSGDDPEVFRPEDFGARGDGSSDATRAVQSAINAAAGAANGSVSLIAGSTYLISEMLVVRAPVVISGGGVFLAAAGIEDNIGIDGGDSLLIFRAEAAGSRLEGLTIDLGGQGRNAVDIAAAGMQVAHVTVLNYAKSVNAGGREHRQTESGLRIRASNVTAEFIHCENMQTSVIDAVPRCITVQGGASDVTLRSISGRRINGGITVGDATNVLIDGYEFHGLSDNGLYLLPESRNIVALNGYLSDTNEPVVFKGANSRISGLTIHNQGQAFGLENATGVVLENVSVTFDRELATRPAFIRTREGNRETSDVELRSINAEMPLGGSVFWLSNGLVRRMRVEDSIFSMSLERDRAQAAYILRQQAGDAVEFRGNDFMLNGPGAASPGAVNLRFPKDSSPQADELIRGNRFSYDGAPARVRIRSAER